MSKQSRCIICKDCQSFKQAPNPRLGTCELEQEGEIIINTVYYNTECIYGLSITIKTPNIQKRLSHDGKSFGTH